MDQRPYPGPPLLFHVRMSTLFIILWITDFVMFLIAIENTLAHGVGGMVLFASEVSENLLSRSGFLYLLYPVWNPDGQCSQHNLQIPSFYL